MPMAKGTPEYEAADAELKASKVYQDWASPSPVAYRVRYPLEGINVSWGYTELASWPRDGWEVEPLYTHPNPAAGEGPKSVVTDAIVAARLVEANSLLRSAASIAWREGVKTNWEPFRKSVDAELAMQLPIVNALNRVVIPGQAAVLVLPDGETYGLTIEQARRALAAALSTPPPTGEREAAVEKGPELLAP